MDNYNRIVILGPEFAELYVGTPTHMMRFWKHEYAIWIAVLLPINNGEFILIGSKFELQC